MSATTRSEDVFLSLPTEPDQSEDAESVPQRTMRSLMGGRCCDCQQHYSAREAVLSIFLGLKNAPRCMPCVSRAMQRLENELWSDLLAHLRGRECYLKAWLEAEQIDGVRDPATAPPMPNSAVLPETNAEAVVADDQWDAGDMGCGELVMALRLRIMKLAAGSVIQVTATDAAAPEDLPAWCRLCGHTLVSQNHPNYWIRRKGD